MTVKITWLDHSGFQIRSESKILYIDLAERATPSEKAEIILVTHIHGDHCDPGIIKKARKDDTVVIAPTNCHSKIGGAVTSLKPNEETTIGDVKIKAVHAYNETRFRSPGQPFHPKGLGVGYIITLEGKTIYHAGDTDFIEEMKHLGPIDVALLPIGGMYTMEAGDGAEAAIAINPKYAIPHHHWDGKFGQYPKDFKKNVETKSDISVVILEIGEEFTLP